MRLIDADALFEAMENAEWYNNADRDEVAEKLIMNAPTICKTGHWIDEGQYDNFFPHHAFACSECGQHLFEIEVTCDYCPFCGAKMELEVDKTH